MKKVRQIAAIIGIVLIFSMYIVTLISAFLIKKYTNELFLASLFSTFVVPVMLYAFLLIYRLVHKQEHTVTINEAKHLGDTSPTDEA